MLPSKEAKREAKWPCGRREWRGFCGSLSWRRHVKEEVKAERRGCLIPEGK